jgi:hypothetical protein
VAAGAVAALTAALQALGIRRPRRPVVCVSNDCIAIILHDKAPWGCASAICVGRPHKHVASVIDCRTSEDGKLFSQGALDTYCACSSPHVTSVSICILRHRCVNTVSKLCQHTRQQSNCVGLPANV